MTPYVPRLGGWLPDHTMPSAASHADSSYAVASGEIARLGSQVQDSVVEINGVLDLRKWCSPIENQGHVGSCVGNAVVGSLEFLQIRSGRSLTDLSRLFVYYNSRLMCGDADKDEGTYIRIAMGTLSSLGTCSEAKWSYDVNAVCVRPSWGSYREAYPNKIGSFYKIAAKGIDLIDNVKHALLCQHPVVFGMVVDQDYMMYKGGVIATPSSTRVSAGQHAQMIVGYDDMQRVFIVRNSWGEWWGESGYAFVPYNYLLMSEANDFWVPTALT